MASDEAIMRKEKTYLNKLNLALVQVRASTEYYVTFVSLNPIDFKAGMAASLANIHLRTCGVLENEPFAVRE